MKLKLKKLVEKAIMPDFAHVGDAGLDFYALTKNEEFTRNGITLTYTTGIAVEIPVGYVGLLFSRSSTATNTGLILGNSVGIIDSGYRGDITFVYKNVSPNGLGKIYNVGDKIGQMVIIQLPNVELEEVDELSDTSRQNGGFGSTGTKKNGKK